MRKNSIKIEKHINPSVRVGDIVKLTDGSSLSHASRDGDFYIVNSYYHDTKLQGNLKDLEAIVLETGIEDRIVYGVERTAYLQDILIQIGKAQFRTASKMVRILDPQDTRLIKLNEMEAGLESLKIKIDSLRKQIKK